MSPPLPRRRKSARRAEILAAAREVFLAQPYEQASIGQIAERAGCVVGTIYGYFENKRDLFDAVLTDFYDALIADIEPKFALLEGTADRLRYLVARHLQITLDEASWLHVFAREALAGEQLEALASKLTDGSLVPFILHAVSTKALSAQEREEIRRLLDRGKNSKG